MLLLLLGLLGLLLSVLLLLGLLLASGGPNPNTSVALHTCNASAIAIAPVVGHLSVRRRRLVQVTSRGLNRSVTAPVPPPRARPAAQQSAIQGT